MAIKNRAAALRWWRQLSMRSKKIFTKQWQSRLIESESRKTWTFDMIYYSDGTIQQIYEYINP